MMMSALLVLMMAGVNGWQALDLLHPIRLPPHPELGGDIPIAWQPNVLFPGYSYDDLLKDYSFENVSLESYDQENPSAAQDEDDLCFPEIQDAKIVRLQRTENENEAQTEADFVENENIIILEQADETEAEIETDFFEPIVENENIIVLEQENETEAESAADFFVPIVENENIVVLERHNEKETQSEADFVENETIVVLEQLIEDSDDEIWSEPLFEAAIEESCLVQEDSEPQNIVLEQLVGTSEDEIWSEPLFEAAIEDQDDSEPLLPPQQDDNADCFDLSSLRDQSPAEGRLLSGRSSRFSSARTDFSEAELESCPKLEQERCVSSAECQERPPTGECNAEQPTEECIAEERCTPTEECIAEERCTPTEECNAKEGSMPTEECNAKEGSMPTEECNAKEGSTPTPTEECNEGITPTGECNAEEGSTPSPTEPSYLDAFRRQAPAPILYEPDQALAEFVRKAVIPELKRKLSARRRALEALSKQDSVALTPNSAPNPAARPSEGLLQSKASEVLLPSALKPSGSFAKKAATRKPRVTFASEPMVMPDSPPPQPAVPVPELARSFSSSRKPSTPFPQPPSELPRSYSSSRKPSTPFPNPPSELPRSYSSSRKPSTPFPLERERASMPQRNRASSEPSPYRPEVFRRAGPALLDDGGVRTPRSSSESWTLTAPPQPKPSGVVQKPPKPKSGPLSQLRRWWTREVSGSGRPSPARRPNDGLR